MAWLIGDSFDFYSGNAASLAGLWDSVATYSGWNINSTTRFGVGRSLSIGNCSTILTKAFGSNEATIFLAVAHRRDGALGGTVYRDANLQLWPLREWPASRAPGYSACSAEAVGR
jgi:hypothetical protein